MVLNVHGLESVDLSGFAYLVVLNLRLKQAQGELVLSQVPENVRTTFQPLGLQSLLRAFPDDDAALRYFGENGEDYGTCGARLKPKPPSDSASARPDQESET